LTHEGLYELVGKNDMKLIGKDRIDVMGFTSLGKLLFASGHPAALGVQGRLFFYSTS
jgi:hypothetical protein